MTPALLPVRPGLHRRVLDFSECHCHCLAQLQWCRACATLLAQAEGVHLPVMEWRWRVLEALLLAHRRSRRRLPTALQHVHRFFSSLSWHLHCCRCPELPRHCRRCRLHIAVDDDASLPLMLYLRMLCSWLRPHLRRFGACSKDRHQGRHNSVYKTLTLLDLEEAHHPQAMESKSAEQTVRNSTVTSCLGK